jgi:DMSO/TMAO reductase YedYZ molybdopterin-dependent catalytic subunit
MPGNMEMRDADTAGKALSAPRGTPARRAGWVAARGALGAALLAAAGGVTAMLVARLVVGIPTPAELFGDQITVLIPLNVFSTLLQTFGHDAKTLFYASVIIAQGVGMALLASGYHGVRAWRLAQAQRRATSGAGTTVESDHPAGVQPARVWTPWLDVAALVTLFWIISAGIIAPLIGGGAFGSGLGGGIVGVLFAEAIPAITWAILFERFVRRASHIADAVSPGRRRLLRQVGFGLAALTGVALAWRFIAEGAALLGLPGAGPSHHVLDLGPVPARISPPPEPNYGPWVPVAGQSLEVTPTANFYYVSKNLAGDPDIAPAGWRLDIGGMVDHPATLTYNQLRGLPALERFHTLECISNELGGDLMSNARWTGARLADLLIGAGIQPGASELIFRASDGYSDSIHLARALDPRALLVYRINGQPLPQPHGFPARLLVPGLYGMKNGKWIERLELTAGGYTGYWEERGWTSEAIVKTTARIDTPTDGDLLAPRATYLAGVAYAGDRGIARVDVSTDAGSTWNAAVLKRPLGTLTWVLWELPWVPTRGTHVVVARAVELDGRVQQPGEAPPLPDGASGYHTITVNVG